MKSSLNPNNLNEGWSFGGDNITYTLSKLSRCSHNACWNDNLMNKRRKAKKYYQLSFEYNFGTKNDEIEFAYHIPYTFSRCEGFLKTIAGHKFVTQEKLCNTISGLEVPMLTITDSSNPSQKKNVIISARVHPGETVSSFIMEGFLKFIVSEEAAHLRSKLVFKVIPMTNPDGVILGNYRCSLSGHDLNRTYLSPNKRLHPTTCAIKRLVEDLTRGKAFNHLNHPV